MKGQGHGMEWDGHWEHRRPLNKGVIKVQKFTRYVLVDVWDEMGCDGQWDEWVV